MNKQFFFLILSLFSSSYALDNQREEPGAKRVCDTPPPFSGRFKEIAVLRTVYIPPLENDLDFDAVDILDPELNVQGTSQRPTSALSDNHSDLSDSDDDRGLRARSVRYARRARGARFKPKASERKSDLFSQGCIKPPTSNPEGTVLFLFLTCARSVSYDPEAERPLKSVTDHRQVCRKSNCRGIVFFSIKKVNRSSNMITCPFCGKTYSDTKQGYVKHFNKHQPVKGGLDGKLLLRNSDGSYKETSDVVTVLR